MLIRKLHKDTSYFLRPTMRNYKHKTEEVTTALDDLETAAKLVKGNKDRRV